MDDLIKRTCGGREMHLDLFKGLVAHSGHKHASVNEVKNKRAYDNYSMQINPDYGKRRCNKGLMLGIFLFNDILMSQKLDKLALTGDKHPIKRDKQNL